MLARTPDLRLSNLNAAVALQPKPLQLQGSSGPLDASLCTMTRGREPGGRGHGIGTVSTRLQGDRPLRNLMQRSFESRLCLLWLFVPSDQRADSEESALLQLHLPSTSSKLYALLDKLQCHKHCS